MKSWLDTETKAILQPSPPDKLAPPDTRAFALVLLATRKKSQSRLFGVLERVAEVTSASVMNMLSRPLPTLIKQGLSYEDALLGQFELIACDAISVFVADEVIGGASDRYLAELFSEVRHSTEFQPVSVRIESMPDTVKGKEFLARFVGPDPVSLPLEVTAMWKKARIMKHWAAKIGERVVVEAR